MAIVLVQSAVLPATNLVAGTTIPLAFTSNNTAGNLLVACMCYGLTSGNPTSVLDTTGNTWVRAGTVYSDATNGQTNAIYYVSSCLAGANTVTVTIPSAIYRSIILSEWSGASAFDQTIGQLATEPNGANGVTSTAVTTTAAGDLIIGYTGQTNGSPNATAVGTGYTILKDADGGSYGPLQAEYQVQSTAGSIAATWTATVANGAWISQIATFKASAGAAAYPFGITTPTPRYR